MPAALLDDVLLGDRVVLEPLIDPAGHAKTRVGREVRPHVLQTIEPVLRQHLMIIGWEAIKSVVNDVLEVLTHAYLLHEFILIAIHPRQLTHVGKMY